MLIALVIYCVLSMVVSLFVGKMLYWGMNDDTPEDQS